MKPSRSEAHPTATALVERLLDQSSAREPAGARACTPVQRHRPAPPIRRIDGSGRDFDALLPAAIVDALPMHIALLDEQGTIWSVNRAWQQFARANGLHSPECGIGTNYLDVCRAGWAGCGDDTEVARKAAEGITAVLRRRSDGFAIEYACHSPDEQRWFELVASPLGSEHFGGAVVMHVNITERMHAQQALAKLASATEEHLRAGEHEQRLLAEALEGERSRLVAAQRVAKVGSWETDLATMAVTWSDETYRIHGTDPRTFAPTHARFLEFIHPDDRDAVDAAFVHSLHDPEACSTEHRVVMANGAVKFVEERWQVFFDEDGMPARAVGTCQDITERKEADEKIKRLNRVHAVLSGVNTLIVHVRDRDELFRAACRIATEQGGFRMAMISVRDGDSTRILPVASSGKSEALMDVIRRRLAAADTASNTMVARAMREKHSIVSNDSGADPQLVFGPLYVEAGVRSVAVLPLVVGDEAVGALALYSREPEFFHDEELKLLMELADDVAFAIDHLDKQERLDYLADYDLLTGLANRTLFLSRLAQDMRGASYGGQQLALGVIDLERFKNINHTLGRAAGDSLLRQVAELLVRTIGDSALVARVGADHFTVVLPRIEQAQDAARLLEKAVQAIHDHPFRLNEGTYRVAARVGIALHPADGIDADALYHNAEAALKKAKRGGDRYLYYTQKMTEAVAGRLMLENQLRQALERQEFELHYQPKITLESGKLVGAEALIRWNDPRTGLVPPGRFIPILEETGLIHEVGLWALRRAVADFLRWRAQGLPAVPIAVNVSSLQLRSHGFVELIQEVIGVGPVARSGLELEITESMLMGDMAQSASVLRSIRGMGVTIAIDDFGTGFSSLGYLSKLPVDSLKIDRSFVTDMTATRQGLALVSTIITLAHSLDLKVVAEGVETEEQSRLLRLLRCDEMQGFLYSKAVPAPAFERRFLAGYRAKPVRRAAAKWLPV